MSKLGYTWYAKDWRSNMDVSELSLQEKGFYRELIDECFLKNSSQIQINERTFCRLHGINSRTFGKVLQKLCESSLIVIENFEDCIISIPSTSKRLGVIEASFNGGKTGSRLGVKNVTKSKEKYKSNTKSNTKSKENTSDKLLTEVKTSDVPLNEVEFYEIALNIHKKIISNIIEAGGSTKKIEGAIYKTWVDPIRFMMFEDGVTREQINKAARFGLQDSFWKTNILTTAGFRKHFDKLILDSNGTKKGQSINERYSKEFQDELKDQLNKFNSAINTQ